MTPLPSEPIRYIALDFDNCICEINDAFRIVWDFFDKLILHPDLSEYYHDLLELWVEEIDKALCDRKLNFLNDDVMMLLKHVEYGGLEIKPRVFVYTNNSNEELVRFIRLVIKKNMKLDPWMISFHPHHPARSNERPDLAPDEPGKSFEGVKACLEHPEDLTPENLMFLDDLLHPIRHTIGERYVHIQPPFMSKDKLLPYVKTFVSAVQKLEKKMPIPHLVELRKHFKNHMYERATHLEYFPSPRQSYQEWDMIDWEHFLALFESFGYSYEDEDDYKRPSLSAYYKCRDLLTQKQDACVL